MVNRTHGADCSALNDPNASSEIEASTIQAPRSLTVRILGDGDPLWDVIGSDSRFSIYHMQRWQQLVTSVFGHRSMYLAAVENGIPLDVLPAFAVSKPLLGTKIISAPYEGCYGGFATDNFVARDALLTEIIAIAHAQKAKFIEIRSRQPLVGLVAKGFILQQPLLISTLDLVDSKSNWNGLSTKHRRNVRYALKNGVDIVEAQSLQQMRVFHKIITDRYHSLGVPFPGRKYFDEIWNSLIQNDLAMLLLAMKKGSIIGGHLLIFSGQDVISKYAGYLKNEDSGRSYASYLLFWEAIRIGAERGFKSFNMGVTGASNTGLLDFKNRFGAQTAPVSFYYFPIRGKIPDLSSIYSGFPTIKKTWSLTPLVITRILGHQINRWFC